MSTEIHRLSHSDAWELIYPDHISCLTSIEQETMQRAMSNSSRIWVGEIDARIVAVWGLIPPTLMSDTAYLWLFTTPHFTEHTFLFIRHSQRAVQQMLAEFPTIVGHGKVGASRSLRWLRWLGAEFSAPQGQFLPFTIRASQWPQDSAQSA